MRALNVGLHPELPADLLRRLTDADFNNANVAIHTALVETPDGGELVYPRLPQPGLASFLVQVRPGSSPSCRRYTVIVIKDGRSSIAPARESCGFGAR